MIFLEPWSIATHIKVLYGGNGGVDKGFQKNLTYTLFILMIKISTTKLMKIEMGYWRIVPDDLSEKLSHIRFSFFMIMRNLR